MWKARFQLTHQRSDCGNVVFPCMLAHCILTSPTSLLFLCFSEEAKWKQYNLVEYILVVFFAGELDEQLQETVWEYNLVEKEEMRYKLIPLWCHSFYMQYYTRGVKKWEALKFNFNLSWFKKKQFYIHCTHKSVGRNCTAGCVHLVFCMLKNLGLQA